MDDNFQFDAIFLISETYESIKYLLIDIGGIINSYFGKVARFLFQLVIFEYAESDPFWTKKTYRAPPLPPYIREDSST